jgi:MFS family permease
VQWVVEAYALFLSALLLVGGSLGDRYGRRRVFILGTCVFALASLWCGLVSGLLELIIARALQGIGAALLVPGSLAILSASFPEAERGRAIGTWSGFTGITTALGPVLGRMAHRSRIVALGVSAQPCRWRQWCSGLRAHMCPRHAIPSNAASIGSARRLRRSHWVRPSMRC